MAASVSTIGYGGTMEWSTDGGTTWTSVGEFLTANLPANTIDKVDRTHMGSAGRVREYTPGFGDPQDVTFEFNFNSTDYGALYTLQAALTVAKWRHTLATEDSTTNGAVYQYDGNVVVSGGEVAVDGVTKVSATINRTGAFTFTAAS
jgi:hypothetical protein